MPDGVCTEPPGKDARLPDGVCTEPPGKDARLPDGVCTEPPGKDADAIAGAADDKANRVDESVMTERVATKWRVIFMGAFSCAHLRLTAM